MDELQFQHNNPHLIENELQKRISNQYSYESQDVIVLPARTSIVEQYVIKKSSPQIHKIMKAPSAILLALYAKIDFNANVAILTFQNNLVEIGIYKLGDGVYEEKSLKWCTLPANLFELCLSSLKDAGIRDSLDSVIFVSNKTIDNKYISAINNAFQKKVIIRTDYDELCHRGASIQSGVLTGKILDVLLLEATSSEIKCIYDKDKELVLVKRNTPIPYRNSYTFTVTSNSPFLRLWIKEGNNKSHMENKTIALLQLPNSPDLVREITIQIDINANWSYQITAIDKNSGETAKVVF